MLVLIMKACPIHQTWTTLIDRDQVMPYSIIVVAQVMVWYQLAIT